MESTRGSWVRVARTRLGNEAVASGTASRRGSSAAKHKENRVLRLPRRDGVYVCTKVFDHVRTVVGTQERHRGSLACFWTAALCRIRLAWSGLHGRYGNGSVCPDRGVHGRATKLGVAWSGSLPREYARYSDYGHNVSLARPRDEASSFACCPNSGRLTRERRRKWGARV
jgi:hypothetical protein